MKLICKQCDKQFEADRSNRIFCSQYCYTTFQINKGGNKPKNGVYKHCLFCNKRFYVPRCEIHKNFCSHQCYLLQRYKIIKPHHVCRICGKQIPKKVWNKKYCSMKCRNNDPEFHLWQGGSLHHNWKGGITSDNEKIRKSNEYKEWQIKVFRRDDYVCQHCGKQGHYLHAHHVKSFSRYHHLRFEVNNGLTLCKYCHQKIHTNLKGIVGYKDIQKRKLHEIQKELI